MTSARYRGELSADGQREGEGTYTYENTFYTYAGQWRNGVKDGRGKLSLADGGWYEGDFMAGEICGQGTRLKATGERYVGSFVDGEMSGVGRIERVDGSVYTGHFVSNRYDGDGRLEVSRGSAEVYEGQWRRGLRSGRGKQAYDDGSSYDGDWNGDIRSGSGVHCDASGRQYDGEWAQGVRHGAATMTTSGEGAVVRTGTWAADVEVGAPTRLAVVAPLGCADAERAAVQTVRCGAKMFTVCAAVCCAEVVASDDDVAAAAATAAAVDETAKLLTKVERRAAAKAAVAAAEELATANAGLESTGLVCVSAETGRVVRISLVCADGAAALPASEESKKAELSAALTKDEANKEGADVIARADGSDDGGGLQAYSSVVAGRVAFEGFMLPTQFPTGLYTLRVEDATPGLAADERIASTSLAVKVE